MHTKIIHEEDVQSSSLFAKIKDDVSSLRKGKVYPEEILNTMGLKFFKTDGLFSIYDNKDKLFFFKRSEGGNFIFDKSEIKFDKKIKSCIKLEGDDVIKRLNEFMANLEQESD